MASIPFLDLNHPTRRLVVDLCRQFYDLGWVSGTGGGIAIREGEWILVAPSGVQKERMEPEDLFVLDRAANIVGRPADPSLKVSECQPLFWEAFRQRNAGAALHSHSLHAVLATHLYREYFEITGLEMIKGLRGMGAFDLLRVPIIPNTERECDLTDALSLAVETNPEVDAVLVEGHGIYVWGETWGQAKTQAECLDYLFAAAVQMHRMGMTLRGVRPEGAQTASPRWKVAAN